MKKLCGSCKHFEEIEDKSLYLKEFDGHCLLSMDLVYADDECDAGSYISVI